MDYGFSTLLVSAISALGTLIQAYNGEKTKQSEIRKAKKRLDNPYKIGTKKVEDVISEDLLHKLSDKAQIEAREFLNILENETDITKVTQAKKDAQVKICFYLNQIKQFNENELPTKLLNNLWSSHACEDCS